MIAWAVHGIVTGGLIALLVFGLCRALRPSPAGRHRMWLIVILALLLPPLGQWSSVGWTTEVRENVDRSGADGAGAKLPHTVSASIDSFEQSLRPENPSVGGSLPSSWELRPLISTSRSTAASLWSRWGWILGLLWGAGSLITAAILTAQVHRWRGLLRRARRVGPRLERRIEQLAREAEIGPPIGVVSSEVTSPYVVGVFRPKLLLPEVLLRSGLNSSTLDTVLLHELAHLRRRDPWVGLLQVVATIIWWWYPILWIARRSMGVAAELSCDSFVISRRPLGRRAYAEALLDTCQRKTERLNPTIAIALGRDTESVVRERLENIMSDRLTPRIRRSESLLSLMIFLFVVPGWVRAIEEGGHEVGLDDVAVSAVAEAEWPVRIEETRSLPRMVNILRVVGNAGNVTVSTSPDDRVHVVAAITPPRKDGVALAEVTADFEDHVSWEVDGDHFVLKTLHRPEEGEGYERSQHGWGIGLEIQLPRELELDVAIGAGNIRASTATGRAKLVTAAGDVELRLPRRGLEDLVAITSSGSLDLRVAEVRNSVLARTVTGTVRIELLRGIPREGVRARSITGNVQISLLDETVDADVSLQTQIGGVDLRTIGSVESEAPGNQRLRRRQRFNGRLGAGGPAIQGITVTGNVRLSVGAGHAIPKSKNEIQPG